MDITLEKAKEKMEKTIESLNSTFSTIRTGRASASLLDRVEANYYGSPTPINQISSISILEPRQLLVKPYDRNDIKAIVAAINASDLGINPIVDGNVVRLIIPALNEERRKELSRLAKKYGEDAKVAIRNIRREVMDELKKNKELPEDSRKDLENQVQKLTDSFVKKIDELCAVKEKEIMTI